MADLYDLHAHTTFSDGSSMDAMVAAAEAAGCAGIGLTDHCILSEDPFGRRERFDLVDTYERRRERIEAVREETAIRVYDAVEMSYVPDEEADIRRFLDEADFEYAVGAVHFAGDHDYTSSSAFADADERTVQAAVDAYYDRLLALIESELFDVVAHIDLPERLDVCRGKTTRAHYRAVAEALADAPTVPEINAGRVRRSLGRVHPDPGVFDAFVERDVSVVLGSDSHRPAEVRRRIPLLRDCLADHPALEVCCPSNLGVDQTAPETDA